MDITIALRNLARTADAVGASLPEALTDALAQEIGLPVLIPTRAEIADEIASHLGSPDFEAKREEALDRLARVEAGSTILRDLENRLTAYRWRVAVEHTAEILDAFREAVADDLQALTVAVAKIPPTTDPSRRDGLDPVLYAALYDATRISSRLEAVAGAVAPLTRPGTVPTFAPTVGHRAGLLVLPEGMSEEHARVLLLGLSDARDFTTTLMENRRKPAVWYAIAHALGARFDLVPADVARANVARMAEARLATKDTKDEARVLMFD